MTPQSNCIFGLAAVEDDVRGCVLTIGNFDGVHLGHRGILDRCRQLAGADGTVVAMTFEPPPDLVVRKDDVPMRIDPVGPKCEHLLAAGADRALVLHTDDLLMAIAPEEFLTAVVRRKLAPAHVVEGPDFGFGLGRSGTVNTLREAGPRLGFETHVVEPARVQLIDGDQTISSTLVRRLLTAGRVGEAGRCLGRNFTLYSTVIPGHGEGRRLGFPTVNLAPNAQVLPRDGIYAGWAEVAGRRRPAAISIGDRPTFGDGRRAVEAHLLGAQGDLYGCEVALEFVRRLRRQETYPDADALREQIAKDVESVRRICG